MMHIPLKLIAHGEDSAGFHAGFIAGYAPGAWLTELDAIGALHRESLELYIVPTSSEDRTPAGLFFVAPGAVLRHGTWRCHAYQAAGSSLFIPVGTVVSPPLTKAEIQRLFPMHRHLLHPGIGHVAFELVDQILLSELVERPCLFDADWHRAHPGVPPSPSLTSVSLHVPQTVEELLSDAKGDIGIQSDELTDGPEGKTKDDSPLYRMKRGGLLGLSALGGLIQSTLGGEGKRSGNGKGNGLMSWAGKALEKLEEKRNRELDRLLKLLKENPAEGLKYALPLNSRTFARGQAPPSATLGPRRTSFSLSALGGGAAVDPWLVQDRMMEDLRRQYREAASQCAASGDHDRAAYIYAELLGDYHAAAAILKEGKRFQEAAKIYKDHLNRPLDAAKCLEEGGMLQAAAELYAELEHHETAGILYDRNGDKAHATYHFRLAVDQEIARGNCLHAAELAETRLGLTDEAEQILLNAWPNAADAVACMQRHLGRLEADEKHRAYLRKLGELKSGADTPPLALKTVELFCLLRKGESVHADVAADHGMILVGDTLPRASKAAVRQRLVGMLPDLVPTDAILRRDANRHAAQDRDAPRPTSKRPAPPTLQEMTKPATTLRLPNGINWSSILSDGSTILALGGHAQTGRSAPDDIRRARTRC